MKQALVISGGGSKGAFSVGVVKELHNTYQLDFDILVGTSTGALIVPLVALGEMKKLEELYSTISTNQILIKYNIGSRLNTNSIFSFEPLTEIIKSIYNDDYYNRLKNSGKEVYLTTVCLQTQELVVFTTASNPLENVPYKVSKIQDADHFRRAVLASASQPVFTPPVKVNKNVSGVLHPDYQFVDGGVREYVGLEIAANAGGEEIFTIIHAAKNFVPEDGVFTNLFGILEQTIATFITDVSDNDLYISKLYNEGLQYIQKVKDKMKTLGVTDADIEKYFLVENGNSAYQNKKPYKVHLIQPENSLGGGPGGLVFDPEEMKGMIVKGQQALQSYVASLNSDDIDWA